MMNRRLALSLLKHSMKTNSARCISTSVVRANEDGQPRRRRATSSALIKGGSAGTTELDTHEFSFEEIREKNKRTFKNAIDLFMKRDTRRRGDIDFIEAALKNMKAYGVERDLDTYKALVDVMPKGKYVPENIVQREFGHYYKHQECITALLHQMNRHNVIPDIEMGDQLEMIFGERSKPMRKYMRMMFWGPKLKNLSPWPLPYYLPSDAEQLAVLAIKRITSVDVHTEIEHFDTETLENSTDPTWVVSGQSPKQRELIENLHKDKSLFVEGPYRLWLQKTSIYYFMLTGEAVPRVEVKPEDFDQDDMKSMQNWVFGHGNPQDFAKEPCIHEQEDRTIFGVCCTGTSTKDSLLSWIRLLQEKNPRLAEIPILFRLAPNFGKISTVEDHGSTLKPVY